MAHRSALQRSGRRVRVGECVAVADKIALFFRRLAHRQRRHRPGRIEERILLAPRRPPHLGKDHRVNMVRVEGVIVGIDPALKGYINGRPTASPVNHPTQAAAAPLQKPFVKPTPGTPRRSTHLLATGDTLSTIAARYRTTVGALKAANPKVDEKKLQVGESLNIVPAPRRGSTP